jgi:hypothetical protein|tara:strand:- start:158 stop:424 length:267 start_codon:yes stop_codon:yes gene_type:complete
MNLNWFYFHCVLALVILVKDYNGTLEESLDRFEKKIGLYTYVDTSHREEEASFYIPPIEEEIDSTFILPDYEGIDVPVDSTMDRGENE